MKMMTSKYDPSRDAFYDVEVDKLETEMKSLGFTEEQIAPKIEEKKQEVVDKVAEIIGVDNMTLTVTEDKVVLEGDKIIPEVPILTPEEVKE